jgi:hypothetical protein
MTRPLYSKRVRTITEGRKLIEQKKAAGFRYVTGAKLEGGGWLIFWSNDIKYKSFK